MSQVHMHREGPPETVLESEPVEAREALRRALQAPPGERRAAVAAVVADHPEFLDGWARLGDHARDDVEAYACYRVGYHRGLDKLRRSGWRGSGYVRWEHAPNRGFLRSLEGLRQAATRIGDDAEAARCDEFLRQLDPSWGREDDGSIDPGTTP